MPVSKKRARKKGSCYSTDGGNGLAGNLQDELRKLEARCHRSELMLAQREASMRRIGSELQKNLTLFEKSCLKFCLKNSEISGRFLELKKWCESLMEFPADIILKTVDDLSDSFRCCTERDDLKLTPMEIRVCQLVRLGVRTKEIARILSLSPLTVERHRNNIRQKMGLRRRKKSLTAVLNSQTR